MAEAEYLPGGIRERMEDLRNRRKLTLKEVAEKTGMPSLQKDPFLCRVCGAAGNKGFIPGGRSV